MLFGEKLDDKVKAAKTLETSSKVLKPYTQQNQKNQNRSKNFKEPTRRQSTYKPTRAGGNHIRNRSLIQAVDQHRRRAGHRGNGINLCNSGSW